MRPHCSATAMVRPRRCCKETSVFLVMSSSGVPICKVLPVFSPFSETIVKFTCLTTKNKYLPTFSCGRRLCHVSIAVGDIMSAEVHERLKEKIIYLPTTSDC
ncbi:unnamed protein product [Choristocarpus tenellus]